MALKVLLLSRDVAERGLIARNLRQDCVITQTGSAADAISLCRTACFDAVVIGDCEMSPVTLVRFVRSHQLASSAARMLVLTSEPYLHAAVCTFANTFFVDPTTLSETIAQIRRRLTDGRKFRVRVVGSRPLLSSLLVEGLGRQYEIEPSEQVGWLCDVDLVIFTPSSLAEVHLQALSELTRILPVLTCADDPSEAESALLRGASAVMQSSATIMEWGAAIESVLAERLCSAVTTRDKELVNRLRAVALETHAAQYLLSCGLTTVARDHLASAISECDGFDPSDDELLALVSSHDEIDDDDEFSFATARVS